MPATPQTHIDNIFIEFKCHFKSLRDYKCMTGLKYGVENEWAFL